MTIEIQPPIKSSRSLRTGDFLLDETNGQLYQLRQHGHKQTFAVVNISSGRTTWNGVCGSIEEAVEGAVEGGLSPLAEGTEIRITV